ncbi:helix-turn-helix domain-containing protein [Caproiciproducens sp.]
MQLQQNYFSTYFKECVGYTPQKYINKKKMEKAISLIMSGDKTITQVSEELGFTSIHYFSRLFKRELGVPPSILEEPVLI